MCSASCFGSTRSCSAATALAIAMVVVNMVLGDTLEFYSNDLLVNGVAGKYVKTRVDESVVAVFTRVKDNGGLPVPAGHQQELKWSDMELQGVQLIDAGFGAGQLLSSPANSWVVTDAEGKAMAWSQCYCTTTTTTTTTTIAIATGTTTLITISSNTITNTINIIATTTIYY